MSAIRALRGSLLPLLMLCTLAGHAAAASDPVCRELREQLALVPDGDGTASYRKYDRAVTEQRNELAAARRELDARGCTFALGQGSAACQSLNIKIERMEANLGDLQDKRNTLSDGASGPRERARLRTALAANGCDEAHGGTGDPEPLPESGGLFDQLGTDRSLGDDTFADPFDENTRIVPQDDTLPAWRTICVRTCDGYYFPMSPMSSRDDFARDQQNCQSICPGTDIRIYYQPAGVEDVGTMMSSATDEAYSDLPTAYLYRRTDVEKPASCGCQRTASAPLNYSVIAGEGSAADEPKEPAIPVPTARPDPAADPETLANERGNFGPAQMKELLKPKAAKTASPPPGDRKVRVVGPAFLPGPEAAKAPPVPAPPAGP